MLYLIKLFTKDHRSLKGLTSFKALIEESEMRKFPDNDLLRHLRLVTQDAEKCASVAQQLLNGKRQTRYACYMFCNSISKETIRKNLLCFRGKLKAKT